MSVKVRFFRDIYHFGSATIENEKKFPAKIAPAYNLPCDYVIHTVGPIVRGKLTKEHERLLKSCYESCLKIADEYKKNYDSDIKVVYNVFKEEDEELYELVKNKDYFFAEWKFDWVTGQKDERKQVYSVWPGSEVSTLW